ncbi:hypothetical protein EV361DRAFT_168542 [Lentinula raphanica]|nr:hypothetical protein EV361DRAFT_168542 [Lentinula raphanica]
MKEDVDHIYGIIGVEPVIASSFHADWKKKSLTEKYMENTTKVLINAAVAIPEPMAEPTPVRTHHSVDELSTGSASRFLSRYPHSPHPSPSPPIPPSPLPPPPNPGSKTNSLKNPNQNPSPAPFVSMTFPLLICSHPICSGCWNTYAMVKIRHEAEHCI